MNVPSHLPTGRVWPLRRILSPHRMAHAHSGVDSYVYVVFGDDGVTGNVQFPITDLNNAIGTDIPTSGDEVRYGVAENLRAIEKYALAHLTLADVAGAWPLRFTTYRTLVRSIGSYAILDYEVDRAFDTRPRSFTVTYDGIIESNGHRSGTVLVKWKQGLGPVATETEQRFVCTEASTSHVVTVGEDSLRNDVVGAASHVAATAKEYVRRARKRLRGG